MSKPTTTTIPRGMLHARTIVRAHTVLASTAFLAALFIACSLHYKRIVKNGVAGYPEEFWPSVSATIGDWYPERSIFQILIALTAGPRFALVFLQYYLTSQAGSSLRQILLITGLVRSFSCGGWVYITSENDHNVHDICMVLYIVCNIPWMIGGIAATSLNNTTARRQRVFITSAFFACLGPIVYFFIQHKVHRVPGAYSYYSIFEWTLIALDVTYDSILELDVKDLEIHILSANKLDGNDNDYSLDQTAHRLGLDGKHSQLVTEKENMETHRLGLYGKHSQLVTEKENMETPLSSAADASLALFENWRQSLSFIVDAYLSYLFWSCLTSLLPSLFYFSVWKLSIAGHEFALLSTLSPGLLSIPFFASWADTKWARTTLHSVSLLALCAFVFDDPLHRLFLVTLATSAATIRQAIDWSSDGIYHGLVLGLGLVISSVSKHANYTNNPVWSFTDKGSWHYNVLGLVLALLSIYEVHSRSPRTTSTRKPYAGATESGTLASAIPLGSLIFCLHAYLSESSTLISWSWTGYANGKPNGPLPHLYGSLTHLAQCVGLLFPLVLLISSTRGVHYVGHPLWFAYGAASTLITSQYKNWPGYIGGLNMTVFLMSLIPLIIQRASLTRSPGKTFFVAYLVSIIFHVTSVFTVAYAFVPGGNYFRERTHFVLISQMACLALAFNWHALKNRAVVPNVLSTRNNGYMRRLVVYILLTSLLVTMYHWPTVGPKPFKTGPRIITSGIWTVHFGLDNQGRDSQRKMMSLVRDMGVDVLGLLETDLHRPVFGNRDLSRVMVEEMGYYVDLGPGPNSHTWGAVLLSKFPIIESRHVLLPSPRGELAPAIVATLDAHGMEVVVVISHNGQEEDPLDRELQSIELARIMAANYPKPTIFLGYVVTKPYALRPSPYEILVTDGQMHDIEGGDIDRWCEYILYRGLYRTAYARLSRGSVTDTELQIGQFVLPRHGFSVTNETIEARYLHSAKESLPTYNWFPLEYYGDERQGGVNGHYYHVFGTPLYYALPEGAII